MPEPEFTLLRRFSAANPGTRWNGFVLWYEKNKCMKGNPVEHFSSHLFRDVSRQSRACFRTPENKKGQPDKNFKKYSYLPG